MFTDAQRELVRALIRAEIAEAIKAHDTGSAASHDSSDEVAKEIATAVSSYLYPLLDLKDKRKAESLRPAEIFQKTSQWKAVRKMAIDLYGPICMRCGSTKEIQVDHIKPKSTHPELSLTIDNLQILCWDCNKTKWKDGSEHDYREATS